MRKPKLIFALASAGMGHATRDVPIISRLSKNYEVHIFCSTHANKWLRKQFPHVHQNHPIKGVKSDGRISLPLVIAKAMMELPKSFFYIFRIAWFILIHRPVAIISDFEAHSVYAGWMTRKLIRTPIISFDHWTTLRMSEIPFALTESEKADLEKWRKTIAMVCPKADRYLVHKTLETRLNSPQARYIRTPVRDSFLEARKNVSSDGAVVVSMGHLTPDDLGLALKASSLRFLVFGASYLRVDGNIEYRPFDDEEYLKALQASPFVIVSANSSAIDALAVGKPLLYSPTPGQFEQRFCGRMFEYLGVAQFAEKLTPQIIDDYIQRLNQYASQAATLDIFGNDQITAELEQTIRELNVELNPSLNSQKVRVQ